MLLIEKTIKLLDDFHYELFYEYVKHLSERSYYPLVLIEVVSRNVNEQQEAEALCKNVYDDTSEKTMAKFYQLAHYTFKLTSFLAKNYPDYLQHNFTRIQCLIGEGKVKEANLLAGLLMDVSEKIEDYGSQIKVLQFLAQQSVLMESSRQALGYLEKTEICQSYSTILNSLFTRFYTYYNLKQKDVEHAGEAYESYFRQYFQHESIKIRLTSIYCYCFLLHFRKSKKFYEKETFELLETLEKDFDKFEYILFPYLVDFGHRVRYLKLRFNMQQAEMEEVMDNALKMIGGHDDILYWNSYINQPELISIFTQANYLASHYMKSFREDYLDFLPTEVLKQIQLLLKKCRNFLKNETLKNEFTLRYINLVTIYGLILLINGRKEDLEEAVERLNGILFDYQQLSFHSYVDSIYSIIGTAYFCLRDFDKVDENYKRYKKTTKDKPVNIGNDLTIHVFYYTAKWLQTSRKQYLNKLQDILQNVHTDHLSGIRDTFEEIIEYFKLPVSLAKNLKKN